MKEQLASVETALLDKEKGFDEPSHSYYFEDGEFKEFEVNDTYGYYGDEFTIERDEFYENWNDKWKTTKEGDRCFGCDNKPRYLETFSAPTQSILQKWLREVHDIHVTILPWKDHNGNEEEYENKIYKFRPMIINNKTFDQYDTWEQALEIGLQESLKLIEIVEK